jgi:hypothetical protein
VPAKALIVKALDMVMSAECGLPSCKPHLSHTSLLGIEYNASNQQEPREWILEITMTSNSVSKIGWRGWYAKRLPAQDPAASRRNRGKS